MSTYNPEINQITDGEFTMSIEVFPLPLPYKNTIHVNVFAGDDAGFSKRITTEQRIAIVERIQTEIFPKFVEYCRAEIANDANKVFELHREITGLDWELK